MMSLLLLTASLTFAKLPTWISEVAQLEKTRESRVLFAEERQRLASLYLLQGKCEKVKDVFSDKREPTVPMTAWDLDALCACNGKCDLIRVNANSPFEQKLAAFRALLVSGHSFDDQAVQKLWLEIQQQPEAQYVAFERLKASKNADDRKLAAALHRQLKSLNIEPK